MVADASGRVNLTAELQSLLCLHVCYRPWHRTQSTGAYKLDKQIKALCCIEWVLWRTLQLKVQQEHVPHHPTDQA